uniref:hypothetical protein n=1 Tax=Piscirickettsia salmonis TaxID=1238 RepID=UPI0039F6B27A
MRLKKTTHRKKSGKTTGYLYTFDLIYPEKTLCVEFEVMHSNILKAKEARKRRYLGRYFAHPMMQNRRAKRDDYKPSAVRVTQRYVP